MLGIALALFSAIVSAISVVFIARYTRESNSLNISIIVTSTGLIVMLPLAVFLTDFSAVNAEAILLFAASGVLTPGLTRLFYYNGLKKLGSSVNSSVFSFYPIYGALLAVLFLNEVLTIGNWLGIGTIISGVIIIEMSCKDNTCSNSSLREWGFPIMGGITFAISAILSKTALTIFNAPFLGVTIAYISAFIPYVALLFLNERSRKDFSVQKNLKLFWLAGIGLAIAWILSFAAVSLASVTIVFPLHATESLFIVFFAFLYLKKQEPLSVKLISGVVMVVLGVLLVII
jgi:drug/metabolite transporter (DMT)-like permease